MFNINCQARGAPMALDSPPLISIVICTYNRAHELAATLESVFAQTYRPVEIVVVDDGSNDATPALAQRYGARIRYHRLDDNIGIARARSWAGELARGEYIAFQDDDDLMPPDRLSTLRNALRRYPEAAFAVGDLALVDEAGRLTGQRWLPASPVAGCEPRLIPDAYRGVLWPELPVVPHTTLFRKADGARIGWFDDTFRYAAEDKDFFARLARGRFGRHRPAAYVPRVVSWVRRGHDSLTGDVPRTELGALQLYAKHMRSLANPDAELYARLQQRVATSLERIVARTGWTNCSAGPDTGDLGAYVSLLSPSMRLRLQWRVRVRHPLRRAVQRLRPVAAS